MPRFKKRGRPLVAVGTSALELLFGAAYYGTGLLLGQGGRLAVLAEKLVNQFAHELSLQVF